jgi:hypothetical protein
MEGRKRPGSPVNIAYFYLADNEKGLKTEAFQHFWSDDQRRVGSSDLSILMRSAKWLSEPSLSDIL